MQLFDQQILSLCWCNISFKTYAAFIPARRLPLHCVITACRFMVTAIAAKPLWLIAERHCSQDELKSTVCGLLWWARRWGYRFIGKMLLAAWSSLCGKWHLRSCKNIIIKAASGKLVWKQHKSLSVCTNTFSPYLFSQQAKSGILTAQQQV